MKSSRTEILYLILSLVVLIFAGFIYLSFKDRYQISTSNSPQSSQVSSSHKDKDDQNSSKDDLQEFEEAMADLEDNPTQAALSNLQNKLDKLNPEDKDTYQERLNAVSNELTLQASAETAVVTAENYQSTENLNAAQALVDQLTTPSVKTELQNRLDIVSANIQSYLTSLQQSPTNPSPEQATVQQP
ncbi:peptidase [Streptococcus caprae]|uniref:Peptidase n=1 Tax=Streptococcus caprae TaxID=1640501 RepID=A0ABV8CWQ0_9STRE